MRTQTHREVVRGTIPKDDLDGGIDLHRTLASGQTYRWRRADGDLFEQPQRHPTPWYETVEDGAIIRIRETDGALEWESNREIESTLRCLLRLDDDLPTILEAGPADPIYRAAIADHRGMRLVKDSLYVGLVSFICSTQMRVERIHVMIQNLMERFGERHELAGRRYSGFPRAEVLAKQEESALRACGLGYRAPYVLETARTIDDGRIPLPDAEGEPYEPLRDRLTAFSGVGPKVADCALLFGAGRLEPVPLDRWIQRAIADHFPDCDRGDYAATSQAIRDRLGPYPGYAQTYLFHHLRTSTDG